MRTGLPYSLAGRRVSVVVAAVLLVGFALAAFMFARIQDVWIDESTQLSGITLPFSDMLEWLSGKDTARFGVPGDRMPPLSYVLDWVWLRCAGPSELGFRLFHAAFVTGGIAILAATIWRELVPVRALIAVVVLVLSPKLLQTAVEIRSYPIFFAATCLQIAMLLRLMRGSVDVDRKLLTVFVIVNLLATYSHFYGLVSSSAFFVAMGLAHLRDRASFRYVVVAYVVYLVGSVGILPFAFAAEDMSHPSAPVGRTDAANYLLKLLGDSANMLSVAGALLFFAGASILLLVNALAATRRIVSGRAKPADWLLPVILSGILATLIGRLIVANFDALKTAYSGWLFAPLALFVASGAPWGSHRWARASEIGAIAALLTGAAASTYLFLVHADEFVHGPRRFVSSVFDQAELPKAVVYESGPEWPFGYFPLVFSGQGRIAQYRPSKDNLALAKITTEMSPLPPQPTLTVVSPYNELILVDIRLRGYGDLRRCNSGACPKFAAGPVEASLLSNGSWRVALVERKFGLYDTQVKRLDRVKPD